MPSADRGGARQAVLWGQHTGQGCLSPLASMRTNSMIKMVICLVCHDSVPRSAARPWGGLWLCEACPRPDTREEAEAKRRLGYDPDHAYDDARDRKEG